VPGTGVGGAGAPKKKLFWAEPITPPNGSAPVIGIDQMKLAAVHGPVTLKLPNGETKPGADGMIIPSGTSISTADGASAAVFMGGVDSARFLPDTKAKVSQNLDGSLRHTSINLQVGTVFSRVGHRPGEKQDYEVRTPEGVAAARGTSFSTTVTNSGGHEVTIVATQDGVVTLTDSSDGHKIIITPLKSGQVSIGSIPKLPSDILAQIFVAFLTDLQQSNMQAIANMANPTAADLAYYNSNLGFDTNTQFYDTLSITFVPLFPSGDVSQFIDQHNNINDIVPATRRALNQQLEPFGNVPLTPF
jgi:ribosomal protein L27